MRSSGTSCSPAPARASTWGGRACATNGLPPARSTRGSATRFAEGIFRVGNVAGEAHPIVAEGISMAMQSSYLLCRHLLERPDEAVAGRALQEIGRAYSAEWQARFATRIRAAAVFAHLAMRPSSARWLLPILKQFPATLTWGAALSGKTSVMAA